MMFIPFFLNLINMRRVRFSTRTKKYDGLSELFLCIQDIFEMKRRYRRISYRKLKKIFSNKKTVYQTLVFLIHLKNRILNAPKNFPTKVFITHMPRKQYYVYGICELIPLIKKIVKLLKN